MRWSSRRGFTSIGQILFGATFIFSGVLKGIDPVGTALKIEEYFSIVGFTLSSQVSLLFSVGLNVFEALLGVAVLIGFMPKLTRVVALVIMSLMALLTLYIYLFNPVSDCGCFGDAFVISNLATFLKNIVLIGIAIYLYINVTDWYQWLSPKHNLYAVFVALFILISFNTANINHLPMIDFRPYKEGRDLIELTQTGGSEGEYVYKFVYEKGGKEKVFGIDDLTEVDSTWTFVRDEIEVIEEAQRPEGADFVLLRQDGSNAVEDLAYEGAQSILVISPDLSATNPKRLVEMTKMSPTPLLLAVGNSGEIWDNPKYAGLEDQFREIYFLDKTTAQTVVRSNPGVLIISGGKIVRKLSGKDFLSELNSESFIEEPYREIQTGDQSIDRFYKYGWVLLTATIYGIILLILGIKSRVRKVRN